MNVIARVNRCWLSKAWSIGFAVLIVLPVTAPFQTVGLADLLFGHAGSVVRMLSNVRLSSGANDSAFSTVPVFDGTEGRLKLQSQTANEIWKCCDFVAAILPDTVTPFRVGRVLRDTVLRI